MLRPPRPPSKSNYLSSNYLSSEPNKLNKFTKLLDPFANQFNTIESGNIKSQPRLVDKKPQLLEFGPQDNFPVLLISPKTSIQNSKIIDTNTNCNSFQPHGFKIRYLSSHGRRSKENIEPNKKNSKKLCQTTTVDIKTGAPEKQKKRKFLPGNYQLITEQYQKNPHQRGIKDKEAFSKTGVLKMEDFNPEQFKRAFIINQSIFDQLLTSTNSIKELQTISKIAHENSFLLILQLGSNRNIKEIQRQAASRRIQIHYLIWNSEKFFQTISILNLQKIQHVQDFLVFSNEQEGTVNMYCCPREPNRRISYFQVQQNDPLQFFLSKIKINECGQIAYPKLEYIKNKTNSINESKKIKEKIELKTKQRQVKQENSNEYIEVSHLSKQFDEVYRNKLVQLIKVLNNQNKVELEKNKNMFSCHNLKLKIPEKIASLMGAYLPANTAYQLASDLVRSNLNNYKHIQQFRNKNRIKAQKNVGKINQQ